MSNRKERKVISEAFKDGVVTPEEMKDIAEVTNTEVPYIHKGLNIDNQNKSKSWKLICPRGNQHVTTDLDNFREKHNVDSRWEVKSND